MNPIRNNVSTATVNSAGPSASFGSNDHKMQGSPFKIATVANSGSNVRKLQGSQFKSATMNATCSTASPRNCTNGYSASHSLEIYNIEDDDQMCASIYSETHLKTPPRQVTQIKIKLNSIQIHFSVFSQLS